MDINKSIRVLLAAIESFKTMNPQTSVLLKKFPETIENKQEIEQGIEKDITRMGFYVKHPGDTEEKLIDKEGKPVEFLRTLLCKISSIEEYYQEMLDFFIPIIYAQVVGNENIAYSEVEKTCMVIYERFLYPYLKDRYALAIKYDKILKTIPGYYSSQDVSDLDIADLPLAELKHTALWFSRVFNYYDLVYIYKYFLESELQMPYMFFLASIDIIREREKKSMKEIQGAKMTLGEDKIKELIEKSNKLNKQFEGNFKKSANFKYVFAGFAVLGVAVAVGASLLITLEKTNKK